MTIIVIGHFHYILLIYEKTIPAALKWKRAASLSYCPSSENRQTSWYFASAKWTEPRMESSCSEWRITSALKLEGLAFRCSFSRKDFKSFSLGSDSSVRSRLRGTTTPVLSSSFTQHSSSFLISIRSVDDPWETREVDRDNIGTSDDKDLVRKNCPKWSALSASDGNAQDTTSPRRMVWLFFLTSEELLLWISAFSFGARSNFSKPRLLQMALPRKITLRWLWESNRSHCLKT